MAQYNTASTLAANLKQVFAKELDKLVPEGMKLIKRVPFVAEDLRPGASYEAAVLLAHEQGFSVGTGAFSLNNSIALTTQRASVTPVSMVLRTAIAYEAAAQAASDKRAFEKWSTLTMGSMMTAFSKRIEVLSFYGNTSIGAVGTISASSAVNTITVSAASFAAGIWAGAEGMQVDVYSALSSGTKRTAGGAATVTSVDLTARTVVLTCANSTDAGNIAVGDFLFYYGNYAAEQNGIDYLITTSGTVYGISNTTYSLWAGTSYSCGSAPLNMQKLLSAIAIPTARGLEEEVDCFISPATFNNLNSDLSALRRIDGSYKANKGESGFEELTYHGPSGKVNIVPSIYVKEGEGFIIPTKRVKRVGGCDISMGLPAMPDESFFLQLPSNAGFEMRLYYNGNTFIETPAKCVKLTAIVNQ